MLEISLKITWSLSYPKEFRIRRKKKYACVSNEFRKYNLYIKSCKSVAYL